MAKLLNYNPYQKSNWMHITNSNTYANHFNGSINVMPFKLCNKANSSACQYFLLQLSLASTS